MAMFGLDAPLGWSSRRSPVYSRHGMVASSQPLASAAGIEILRQGGNAADAAVCVASVLAVVEPCSTGMGGDFFMLYYDAKTQRVSAVNGSGRCAAELTLERASADASLPEGKMAMDPSHAHCVTVPGAVRGWEDSTAKFGTKSLKQLLVPAIDLAKKGFPVGPVTADLWSKVTPQLLRWQSIGDAVSPDELLVPISPQQPSTTPPSLKSSKTEGNPGLRAPISGEIFKRPELASVLEEVGEKGAGAFYDPEGSIAQSICRAVQACGGVLSTNDLAAHTSSTFPDPISVEYRGIRIFEHPPNGQGLCALIALNTLRFVDPNFLGPSSQPEKRLHIMVEAMRLAFADARQYIADPTTSCPQELVSALLSDEYGRRRAAKIDTTTWKAKSSHQVGIPLASCDTVSFQVVDAVGNAASVVNSNYDGFGSGIVPKGLGFSLQNRGANFSLDPTHPNCLAPQKRPYHTIIPGIALRKDGSLYATFTNMGGFMQPQGHVQLISNMLDLGMDPQSAIDFPRFCIADGSSDGKVFFEDGTSPEVLQALADGGHKIGTEVVRGSQRSLFGRAQIIRLEDPKCDLLCAGSDGRADGCAIPLLEPPSDSCVNSTQIQADVPVSNSIMGEVFIYDRSLAAMLCIGGASRDHLRGLVIFVPGLTDGLLGLSYVSSLAAAVNEVGYAFVQPILSSSYGGFGTSSLDKDVEEIDKLLECERIQSLLSPPTRNVVIVGHSTGCQDAVHYTKHGANRQRVSLIVLQAPVSDREAMLLEASRISESGPEGVDGFEQLANSLEFALSHAQNPDSKKVLMPHDCPFTYQIPVTCSRFHSLGAKMSSEDMFSTDLSVEEMTAQVGHVAIEAGVRSLLVFSGADEYVSEELKANYADFARRLSAAMGGVTAGGTGMRKMEAGASKGKNSYWSTWKILEGASHALDSNEHANAFIQLVKLALADSTFH